MVKGFAEPVRWMIEDKGKGLDKEQLASSGVGLINRDERARSIDGELQVKPTPNEGTNVMLDVLRQ